MSADQYQNIHIDELANLRHEAELFQKLNDDLIRILGLTEKVHSDWMADYVEEALRHLKNRVAELEGLLRGANGAIDTRQARINELETRLARLPPHLREALKRSVEPPVGGPCRS